MAHRKALSNRFSRLYQRAAKRAARRVEQSGRADIKVVEMRLRAQLRELEREYRAKEREYIKQFRHEIATLKAQGLVPRTYDARSVVPNPYLEGARTRFAEILLGEKKARPVKSRSAIDALRDMGVRVVRGRAILPPEQHVRKGRIVTRVERGPRGERIIRLRGDFEQKIADVFAKLKPGQYVGFRVAGNPYRTLFKSQASLMRELNKYRTSEPELENWLSIFEVSDESDFAEQMAEADAEREAERARKRDQRRRSRRAKGKKGNAGKSISSRKR